MDRRLALTVRSMEPADWPAVAAIHTEGIATGNATFDTEPPTLDEFVAERETLRLVGTEDEVVVGWVAAAPVSDRCVYGGVIEHSVFVASDARGRGVGRALLDALIVEAEASGIWTIQAGIFPENLASLRLHDAAGFRRVGTRERLGQLNGVWRDVVMVERRSTVV